MRGFGRTSADLLALRTARYEVNVIADRSQLTGAPVLFEDYPSARNLIGTLKRVGGGGPFSWVADAESVEGSSAVETAAVAAPPPGLAATFPADS